MKKLIFSTGIILVVLSLLLFFLDPFIPEEDINYGTRQMSLGEPPDNSVKSTKIEEWLGDFGGEYDFSLLVERVGDLVTVEVYVDGKLEDKFIEIYKMDKTTYKGKQRIEIYITAVNYSGFYGKSLNFDYSSRLRRYGGYRYPKFYPLLALPIGMSLIALSLVLGSRLPKPPHLT